ncbi:lipid A deacylase LpxR family protein [Xanthomonas campestris pv. phormiicola]|nr:lipid A deacylase LpxR family protein [Xanthomonas campestris pv. phormiicola]
MRPAGEHSAMAAAGWAAAVGMASVRRHRRALDGARTDAARAVRAANRSAPLGGRLAAGAAPMRGRWRATLAQYRRTREFDQQREPAVSGSLSRAF